jgi:hypothetical protein
VELDGDPLRSLEARIRDENGGRSQRERFAHDVSAWAEAGRFLPRP